MDFPAIFSRAPKLEVEVRVQNKAEIIILGELACRKISH